MPPSKPQVVNLKDYRLKKGAKDSDVSKTSTNPPAMPINKKSKSNLYNENILNKAHKLQSFTEDLQKLLVKHSSSEIQNYELATVMTVLLRELIETSFVERVTEGKIEGRTLLIKHLIKLLNQSDLAK